MTGGASDATAVHGAGSVRDGDSGGAAYETVNSLGISFSNITYGQLCQAIDDRIKSGTPGYIVTPNVDHVVRVKRDAAFRRAYEGAWLVLADGTPLMWAMRLLGRPLVSKLSGSDMVPRLSSWAADSGRRIFLFGAAPGVAEEAAAVLRDRHPALNIVGTYSPPLGFEKSAEEEAKAIEAVRIAKADLVFVALGSPKQEVWVSKNYQAFGPSVVMGIGASLDFLSGRVKRAPRWMQRSGLEWFWRLASEPRRLWRRYLLYDSAFVLIFLRAFWKGR
jgi:N-acetylglucosaminyldiphosphoundecaprenol N-acetyl-beta-D-mannosaminyltransferase